VCRTWRESVWAMCAARGENRCGFKLQIAAAKDFCALGCLGLQSTRAGSNPWSRPVGHIDKLSCPPTLRMTVAQRLDDSDPLKYG
jgi:hypothetical protein